jgi:hypothetical protein
MLDRAPEGSTPRSFNPASTGGAPAPVAAPSAPASPDDEIKIEDIPF